MYGLIGKKLGHSFSASFFNDKFMKEGIDNSYQLFPLDSIKEFPELLKKHPDLQGLNVTIPYKSEVIPYLDSLSDEAIEIGAVNVIKITREDGDLFLKGFNSDCIGFRESLIPLLNEEIKNALVLGTGGASKAVNFILNNLRIKVTNVSRSPKKGEMTYSDIDKEILEENLLIVNTTPLGMYPEIENYPPIPYQFLSERHLCYDLVYNPLETMFLKKAKEMGAKIKNGIEMLHLQALAAWNIWNR